ncbi:hypothetical protein PsorP6_010369 [Peronosclerospora sorghi]|uniref:Uncharacterized protein n=1 Tax=Peronosclerospora sorghi TaxID=230839 RepID=A0ACC0VVV3_9STRA|nr:hypothetical protein PsorP6_010369 [Peronosclerospora sorghi]
MAEARDGKREVVDDAVWSLSSVKPGNGVDQLRDSGYSLPRVSTARAGHHVSTYWQSDGIPLHWINIQFARKMTIHEVALYLDYKRDESYTPKKIAIRSGSTLHDLKNIFMCVM